MAEQHEPSVPDLILARLLVMPEDQLDDVIRNEILGRIPRGRVISGARLVRHFWQNPLHGSPAFRFPSLQPGLAHFAVEPPSPSWLDRWRSFKRRALGLPGRRVADLVRMYASESGRPICARMDYCRGKNKVTEVVGNFRDMEEEFGGAAGEVAEELLERAEEASLEFVKEFSGIVAEEIAENVFPAVLIVKLFKYGLGDLCPCCEPCDGSGKSGDVKCGTCRGDGIQEPFPELRSGSL